MLQKMIMGSSGGDKAPLQIALMGRWYSGNAVRSVFGLKDDQISTFGYTKGKLVSKSDNSVTCRLLNGTYPSDWHTLAINEEFDVTPMGTGGFFEVEQSTAIADMQASIFEFYN